MAAAATPGAAPFIGRAEAVDLLRRRIDEARAGRGGMSLVTGEAGVGKSSLLRLVAAEGASRGLEVRWARPGDLEPLPPLQLVRDLLAGRPEPAGGRSAPDLGAGGSLAALVPPTGPAPALIGFAASAEGRGPAALAAPEPWFDAVGRAGPEVAAPGPPAFRSLVDDLRRLGEAGPTVLVLEDLDQADDASLEFLLFALPSLARRPLWFLGSSLPLAQIPEARRAWLERLHREAGLEEVPLRPLTSPELAELVRALVPGREVPSEELATLHARSGGNPLFLERLLRVPGVPEPTGFGPAKDGGDAAVRALGALPPDELRVLGFAAVLGRSFPFALLWTATEEDEERLAELVEGLILRGILREGVDERIEFLSEELRSRAYAGLTAAHRRLLHRRAAEALERTGLADPPTVYALALHSHLGRLGEAAAEYNRIAGELAAHQGSPAVARIHLERALESLRSAPSPDPSEELELLLDLVGQLDRLGELKEADRLLTDAFRRPALVGAATPGQRALAQLCHARLLTGQGRWGEADALTRQLLDSPDVRMGPRTLLAAHRLRGEFHYYRGEYADSLRHQEEAQRLARALRDDREIALQTVRIANALAMMPGRTEEALASYRLAADVLVGLGDLGEASYARLFLGVIESQRGRHREAVEELDKALTLAEEGHDLRRIGWARFNLADLERERGNLPAARRHNARALTVLTEIGDRFGLLQVHLVEGKILLAEGRLGAAEVELLEAFRWARELQAPADEVEVQLRLVEVALAQGDIDRARRRSEEADRIGIDRRPELLDEWKAVRARIPAGADGPA